MNVTLRKGDNRELIKELLDNSIDAIVTDPPYGLGDEPDALEMLRDWIAVGHHEVKGRGFMGKEWDAFVPQPDFWKECYRVLKPGGHLLSFGGTRTFDLIVLGLRIAGFEIRDTLMWVYGSGFPKGHDISKAIDKAAGAEREVIGVSSRGSGAQPLKLINHSKGDTGIGYADGSGKVFSITAPVTLEAQKWDGWNVNLTPSYEPIVLVRKPLEGTYVENILKWGTGALNIEGCRVPILDGAKMARNNKEGRNGWKNSSGGKSSAALNGEPSGRWPKNFVHDGSDEVLEMFPQTGVSSGGRIANISKTSKIYGNGKELGVDLPKDVVRGDPGFGDSASAARFFYCAKVSKQERNAGLDGLPTYQYSYDGRDKEIENPYQRNGSISENPHPTVKPIALLKYLVRLVTPPNGVVFDPFMGSGSTGCATVIEGFDFIGYELDAEGLNMLEVAEKRINYWRKTAWIEEGDVLEVIVDKNDYSNLPMFEVTK